QPDRPATRRSGVLPGPDRWGKPAHPAGNGQVWPARRVRSMWNWLRSLGSWFFATPGQAAEKPPGQPHPGSSSAAPERPQPAALPPSAGKPPGLGWQPLAQTSAEEDTVAPPLASGPADHAPILGIDLGTSHSAVAVVRLGKVEVIPNQEGEYLTPSVV